jgi:hypothetical protein
MIRSILNKIFIGIIVNLTLLFNVNTQKSNFNDTINIRRAFFNYEKNWDKFANKITNYEDRGNKIGLICKIDKENYEMLFFNAYKGWNYFNTYGRILYLFNKDKELLKVRVYFHESDNSYMLFLRNKPGKFDVYLFDRLFIKDIPYYFSFETLRIISLDVIINQLTKNQIADNLLINIDDKQLKQKFIDKVLIKSMTKKYVADGAKDEFGEFVYISSGLKQNQNEMGYNCSGFLKEIADNYIRLNKPDFGYLSIKDLKMPRSDIRRNSDFRYNNLTDDPFFGLDWSLNIIDKINYYCNYQSVKAEEYTKDEYFEYKQNQGYDVNNLKEIIFRDQLKDYSYFYILVFNKLKAVTPMIPYYYHISVIVPYFSSHRFYIRVFESNDETSFDSLIKKHEKDKVNIIKVPLPLVNL